SSHAVVLGGALLAAAVCLFWSCGPSGGASAGADTPSAHDVPADAPAQLSSAKSANAPGCAATRETLGPLPKVEPAQLTLGYSLELLSHQFDLDQVLLSPEQIDNFNLALQVPRPDYHPQRDLLEPFDPVE